MSRRERPDEVGGRAGEVGGRAGPARVGTVRSCRRWNSRQCGLAQGLAGFWKLKEVVRLQRQMFSHMCGMVITVIL